MESVWKDSGRTQDARQVFRRGAYHWNNTAETESSMRSTWWETVWLTCSETSRQCNSPAADYLHMARWEIMCSWENIAVRQSTLPETGTE